jgi:hypothetical protein
MNARTHDMPIRRPTVAHLTVLGILAMAFLAQTVEGSPTSRPIPLDLLDGVTTVPADTGDGLSTENAGGTPNSDSAGIPRCGFGIATGNLAALLGLCALRLNGTARRRSASKNVSDSR